MHRARVATDDEALAALAGPAARFREEALLDRGEALDAAAPPGCTSTVDTREERPELVLQQVHACAEAVVVLGDAWFPGWAATVDGHDAVPARADFFLKAVRVPAGDHQVRWEYRPTPFRVGGVLSGLAWLAILGALVVLRRLPGGPVG